jgi:hypothetical protein
VYEFCDVEVQGLGCTPGLLSWVLFFFLPLIVGDIA